MRPVDVLDIQVGLIKMYRSDFGRQYVRGFVQSDKSGYLSFMKGNPTQLADREAFALDAAPTYQIAADMVSVAEQASKSWKPEPVRPDDFPSPAGFVWLDQPIYIVDVNRMRINIRAILWYPSPITVTFAAPGADLEGAPKTEMGGVCVTLYSDTLDTEDDGCAEIRALVDEGMPFHRLSPLEYTAIPFGVSAHGLPEVWAVKHDRGRVVDLANFLQAFWRLTQQRIAVPTPARIDRQTRRRTQRELHNPQWEPQVTVVTLRRAQTRDGDPDACPTAVNWSSRWMVDGFWRNQWYPSLGDHRQIWIAPYVKGPDWLPLVVRDKVYKWTR